MIEVIALRWERGWELHIVGHGVTQTRRLVHAERMVREYLDLDDLDDAATVPINVTVEVEGLTPRVAEAREKVARAAAAQMEAAAVAGAVARELVAVGLTVKEVGVVLGIEKRRVSQLLKG